MAERIRIGIICDIHLTADARSPQYAFLQCAAEQMKKDGVDAVICPGDISGYGSVEAWEQYREVFREFRHYEVIGNTDIRDRATKEKIIHFEKECEFTAGKRRVIGINTQEARIEEEERRRLAGAKPGDIIFMHHYPQSMEEESRNWLFAFLEKVPVILIHGHGHRWFDHYVGKSRILGVRGLDPDKAMHRFPCINYLDVTDETVEISETLFGIPEETAADFAGFFGISCVDNMRDVSYALEHGIYGVELRCMGDDWRPDDALLPLLKQWREKTNGYLSVHMPNLKYKDHEISGKEQWARALDYAAAIGADGLTMHPPRVSLADIPEGGVVWEEFLSQYLLVSEKMPPGAGLGIENLHLNPGERADETRKFCYTPEEVSQWIDTLNLRTGEKRFGHVLDVGHARNNGPIAERYPVSRWYCIMGNKTVAYHIHQVTNGEDGMHNHGPIENWFGPMINYTAFLYAWQQRLLNHVPVFLEVQGCENYEKSMRGFRELVDAARAEDVIMVKEKV